jgi:hypothetical protein
MENTPKIITIIGLALEGLSVITLFVVGFMFKSLFTREFFLELDPNIDLNEVDMILEIYGIIGTVMIVMAIIMVFIFALNLFLFIKLMMGKFDEETARKVYTYQLIWGIISIFSNTLTGILYIVSAVQGRNGQKDRIDTRPGI